MLVVNFLDADIPTPFAETATVVRPQSEPLEEKLRIRAARAPEPLCKGKAIIISESNM